MSQLGFRLKRFVADRRGDLDHQLIRDIRAARLTYLTEAKLESIALSCQTLERDGVPGCFVEAGCALGGSSILIGRTKAVDRPFRVYDVFDMIPPPTDDDPEDVQERYAKIVAGGSTGIGGDTYYGYESDLYDKVLGNLARFGVTPEKDQVSLVKGLVQDTMHFDGPVAFAHVDVDWYDPVKTCLERVFPRLSPGGCIILDDYHDWGGCRKATDEFLATAGDALKRDDSAGSLKLIRR